LANALAAAGAFHRKIGILSRELRVGLTNQTVLGELLVAVVDALAQVRCSDAFSRVLSMADFTAVGGLRHLQGMPTLREQVQSLPHLEPGEALRAPLARSSWSDALSSKRRKALLQALLSPLLARGPGGTAGSAGRFRRACRRRCMRRTAPTKAKAPTTGGVRLARVVQDNPKGHALLSFCDVRLGCVPDVHVHTRSRHETALLRDYDQSEQAK
jgi:hypothetical protein